MYRDAGADMIFAEALTDLAQYRKLARAVGVPVLANITEFGKTPLFTLKELHTAGVGLALYPLSAFRAMSAAALKVYRTVRLARHPKGAASANANARRTLRFDRIITLTRRKWTIFSNGKRNDRCPGRGGMNAISAMGGAFAESI